MPESGSKRLFCRFIELVVIVTLTVVLYATVGIQQLIKGLKLCWKAVWPVLIAILSPLFWICRKLLELAVIIDFRFLHDPKVSSTCKCPACGCRSKHAFQFVVEYEAIIHSCAVCKAQFAQAPIMPINKWRIQQEIKSPSQVDKPVLPVA